MNSPLRHQNVVSWAKGYPVGNGVRFSVVLEPDMAKAITAAARKEQISTAEKIRRLLAEAMA